MNESSVSHNLVIPGEIDQYPFWIQAGVLLDGSSKPVKGANLVFDSEEILFVGGKDNLPDARLLKPNQTSPDITLEDYTILPGLIDAHAHIFLEGGELDVEKRKSFLNLASEAKVQLAEERIQKLIPFGIMAYRDAGDKDGVGLAMSTAYRADRYRSYPYIDSPGAAIHRRGRYGSFMGEPLEEFESEEDCVKDRIKKGAYRIKLIPTGIINFKKGQVTASPQMNIDEIEHLVSTANTYNKQTFAHASGVDGIELVVEGGVDSVEHGYFITRNQLAKMRDRDIAWVPTFAPVQQQVDKAEEIGWDKNIVGNLQKILDGHAESLLYAHEIGVKIIAGSDAGSFAVPHALGLLYELEQMEKAGMDSLSIINSATGVATHRLGFDEKLGQLKEGFKPRMILTKHDVLSTVSNLKMEKTCIFDGRIYSQKNMDEHGL